MWYTDGSSVLSIDPDGYEGNCIMVNNVSENDARYAQTVEVEPNTLYRISCMCKVENVGDEGIGANISIENTFCYSDILTDTGGEWVYLELYGYTGEDQTELTIFARVGGYSGEATGCAWFDNFEMVQLDEEPEGVVVQDFTPVGSSGSSSLDSSDTEEEEEPDRNTEMYVLLTCIYVLAVVAVARKYGRSPERSSEYYRNCMIVLTLIALAIRLIFAAIVPGYNTDVNCFTSWANTMASAGPVQFYQSGTWCDYPPLYMWMLAPIGYLQSALGLTFRSGAQLVLLKLWPILFDLAASWLIWRKAKDTVGDRGALLLAAFFALNPAVFTDSAAWGQIDSVFTLLIALCALWAVDERYLPSLVSFAAAMLIKPQSLLFAPIGLFAIIVSRVRGEVLVKENGLNGTVETKVIRDEKEGHNALIWVIAAAIAGGCLALCCALGAPTVLICILAVLCVALFVIMAVYAFSPKRGSIGKPLRSMVLGIIAALGLIYIVAFISCFDASQGVVNMLVSPITWLRDLYTETMSGYQYVTLNALNLYYLFDLNWAPLASHPAASTFAWICFAASYVYCAVLCALSKDRRNLPMIGGTLIVLIFTFGPMIHERYAYPAILLLLLGYIVVRDKRVLISLTALSATLFLNEVLVLQGGMTAYNGGHLQSAENWINYPLSAINVLNALFLAWTTLDVCVLGHVYQIHPCKAEEQSPGERDLLKPKDYKLHLKRIDAILMSVVTVIYAIVAFVNLGSTKAPQTTWVSGAAGDQIVFDLGDVETFRMTYYGNICDTNFTVELSNDGTNWTEAYYAQYDQGEIFRWIWYVPQTVDGSTATGTTEPTDDGSAYVTFSGYDGETYPFQTARYVRITSVAAILKLMEGAFLDADSEVLPGTISSVSDGVDMDEALLLIDEQDTVPAYPSYYNSTYFDEIYHARTAYEHLNGLSTYEWTHPPLGKVLMMIGIKIFGMTPFGWRFMGTLIGVLMVPLMYLLVKQLTKNTKLSFIAMFLLSVDAMHFTQTRIATIDSYAVFWIMLMYFFMFRYCQMPWHSSRDFWRSLIPLGLCGITMGIAWATKWIGLYASVGLAILFFWTLWRHWREYRAAKVYVTKDKATQELCQGTTETFWTAAVVTIAFCLIFFIVIPLIIYYFSYYWYLRGTGMESFSEMFTFTRIKQVIDLQQTMFNYHAGLSGDTHYFRSPWYEWPIIWWPMWYYSGTAYMPDGVISSISCMGNPAVWWFGLAALIFVIVRMSAMRRAPKEYTLVVVGFASQYLPWVLVPRSTFIYHYFASVPFIIMASVLMLDWVRTKSRKAFKVASIVLMVAALILFIAFYPLESGMPVARSYAQYLRWFNWYNF